MKPKTGWALVDKRGNIVIVENQILVYKTRA